MILAFILTIHSVFGDDTLCSNLWSVINTMQNGIDLATFDLFGQHPGWSQLPLLKYTCNKGITWTNSINKITYNIPDQFAEQPISIPDDVTSTTFHQSTNISDKKTYMSKSIGLGYKFGMFSATLSLSHSYQVMTIDTRLWGEINSSISAFKINFIPYQISPQLIQLSDNAQNYINTTIKINAQIFNESTVELYEQFFDYFGTHFFSYAYTGGVFRLQYETDLYLLYQMSETQISLQGQASFYNFLLASGAISGSKQIINASFSSMTNIIETCKGGSFCPSNPSDYDQWQISVASAPWIMSAEFIPMYVLIYDNAEISNSFQQAIINHEQISYLKNEIMGNLDSVKNKIKYSVNSSSTYNETQLCLYPHYDTKSITNKCPGNNITCCDGPSGYKTMYESYNQYHSYVNNDLNAFYSKLISIQKQLIYDINLIENYTNILLSSVIIKNETLFNITASKWENIVNTIQTKPEWELCRWINKNSCSHLNANKKHVCHMGACNTQDYGKCHQPVTFNVSYFAGLVSSFD